MQKMLVPIAMAHEGYGIKKESGVRDKYVCCLHPCLGRTSKWSLFELNRHRERYHDAGPVSGRLRGKQRSGKWPQRSKRANENALRRERLDVKKKCDKQETTYKHRLIKEAMATEGVFHQGELTEEAQRNIEVALDNYKSRREERERATLARIQMKENLALEADCRYPEEIVENVKNLGSTSESPKVLEDEDEDEEYLLKVEPDSPWLLNNAEASISCRRTFSMYDDMSEEPERSEENFGKLGSDSTPSRNNFEAVINRGMYGSSQGRKPMMWQEASLTPENGRTHRKRKTGLDLKGELSTVESKRVNGGMRIADSIPGRGTVVVGSKIKKNFDGRIYHGEIVGYELLYKIRYEDGDFEELTWEELQPRLVSAEGGFLSK
ncbi:uncharacterized protein LOC131045782 isoform X1 [Cryptomeria japonica]|uniref:uncharacterized protein LOC131045782 isoform X1 n=2 Tax=Cryptomeria japonica TaxID=3369 RepID=UPI0025AD7CA4|nr:uncharacterized protein LOC131045782 isoform X1 [Cryptomeria japonica]XP_059077410.1 uncharacterized protein LOC131045782 isoform X1 [Cryptomeria japonica]